MFQNIKILLKKWNWTIIVSKKWTEKDISNVASKIASTSDFKKIENGKAVFVNYKGVRVGAIKTNGKIGTVFPDGTKQPYIVKRGEHTDNRKNLRL